MDRKGLIAAMAFLTIGVIIGIVFTTIPSQSAKSQYDYVDVEALLTAKKATASTDYITIDGRLYDAKLPIVSIRGRIYRPEFTPGNCIIYVLVEE